MGVCVFDEQFNSLMEVLRDMLDLIERQRLSKMVNEIPDHEDLEQRRYSAPNDPRANRDKITTKSRLLRRRTQDLWQEFVLALL